MLLPLLLAIAGQSTPLPPPAANPTVSPKPAAKLPPANALPPPGDGEEEREEHCEASF
jgi:hypothetical protein